MLADGLSTATALPLSACPPLAPVARDCDVLVAEIASGHGSIATIIRKIHEVELDPQNVLNPFDESGGNTALLPTLLQRLDERAAAHTHAIEALCHQHFQGFSDSIREVLQVRSSLEQLRSNLDQTSNGVRTSTHKLCAKVEALEAGQQTLSNIEKAIEALQLCLPILDQFSRVRRNIQENRFFPALKALGFLEHSQLPLISHFHFSQQLVAQIPDIRDTIKRRSQEQHTDFLQSVRRHSVRLGALAMQHTSRKTGLKLGHLLQQSAAEAAPAAVSARPGNPFGEAADVAGSVEEDWKHLERLHRTSMAHPPSSPQSLGVNGSGHEDTEWSGITAVEEDGECNIEDLVDFAPIYRCLHIHSVLGERTAFERHYRYQRKSQWQLCVNMSAGQQASLKNYSEFFAALVGFFVVEDYVFHTIPGMSNKNYLDELWAESTQKVVQILRVHVEHVPTREPLLRLKDVCVVFTRTMQCLGFNVAALKEAFAVVRTRYHKLVAKDQETRFQEIFQHDDYSAVVVRNAAEYQMVLDLYPCHSPEFDVLPYPKRLPFSMMVPRIFQTLRDFITQCHQFSENLDLSVTEREDMLYKAANLVFSGIMKECTSSVLRRMHGNLLQLIQFSINMDELQASCTKLEEHIQNLLTAQHNASQQAALGDTQTEDASSNALSGIGVPNSSGGTSRGGASVPRSRLHGVALFKEMRGEAESLIYIAFTEKIEDFFKLAAYDWLDEESASSSASVGGEAQSYVRDLTRYLDSTFRSFTNLPPKLAQAACMASCNHMHKLLLHTVIDVSSPAKCLTERALQQVSVDLRECELFAQREPVAGVDKETLAMAFQELRQLLDLVLKDQWELYFTTYGKPNSPFDRVPITSAMRVIDKMREAEKRRPTSFFQVVKKGERERRKRLEDVLKQLKDLQTASNAQQH